MTSELKAINVDEPFLSQKAFRDFIKLPSDEPSPKVGVHNLLKVTREVIKHELVSCGCSEAELIGCQLEYEIAQESSQETGEIYSFKWNQISESKKTTEDVEEIPEELPDVASDTDNPLSYEFMSKLNQRLDEVSLDLDGVRLSGSRVDFGRLGDSSCRKKCDQDPNDNKFYRRWFCNGNPMDWVRENGRKVKCELGIRPGSGTGSQLPIERE